MIIGKTEYTDKKEIENLYFDIPTQVMYTPKWEDKSRAGIAYCEEIMSAEDGQLISVWNAKYIKFLSWVPFAEFIEEEEENND